MSVVDRSSAVRAWTVPDGWKLVLGTRMPGRAAALIARVSPVSRSAYGRLAGDRAVDVVPLVGAEGLAVERTCAFSPGTLRRLHVSPCGACVAISGEPDEPSEVRWLAEDRDAQRIPDEGVFGLVGATLAVAGRYTATELELLDLAAWQAHALEARDGEVMEDVAVSPDGQWLVATTLRSKLMPVWNVSTRQRARRLSPERVRVLGTPVPVFSPDGALLACGASVKEGKIIRHAVQLFGVGGKWPKRAPLELGEGYLTTLAFSSSGRRVLTAQCQVRRVDIQIWDHERASLLHRIELAPTLQERPAVAFLGTSDDDALTYVGMEGERSLWSFPTP
jgi:WD40 repeat protein